MNLIPRNGFEFVRLETASREFVADVQIRQAIHPPEVLVWGSRVFTFDRRIGGVTYREAFCEFVSENLPIRMNTEQAARSEDQPCSK